MRGFDVAAWVETLLPSTCLLCRRPLAWGERGLCAGCWAAVTPDLGPRCARCGRPAADGAECLACRQRPPVQEGTVVWGEHDGALRHAILAAKHAGRDEVARPLGTRLAGRVVQAAWARDVEVVTAVPSHPLRRVRRRAVLAELLAREVARAIGRPFRLLLVRRGLGRQAGRSAAVRRRLPVRTFRVRRWARVPQRVLVVDDVTTTGATLRVAARVLKAAGAHAVWCAALAAAPDARRLP